MNLAAQSKNLLATLILATLPALAGAAPDADESGMIDRGRYLAKISGCNDCHTPGYAQSGGRVAEGAWLTGDRLGWKGPWGTTYPSNLRIYMAGLSEGEWLERARTLNARPPMPWFALREMSERDLRGLYRFVRALGPAGEPAPAFVPPGESPLGPVVSFPMPPG